MNSPFPGMDPYLETPALWSDFNASFITYWRDALIDCLPSNYEARIIEEETHERRIEILHRPDRTLVAVLEMLSPANKEEPGRAFYLSKRNSLLHHQVHLVEVDLLLKEQRMPLEPDLPLGDYYALVSRWNQRPACQVYAWTLQQPIPPLPIPLLPPDPDVWIDLGAVFATTFARGRYARSIDYAAAPPMALDAVRLSWVTERAAGEVAGRLQEKPDVETHP